jgi:hypothetical protein
MSLPQVSWLFFKKRAKRRYLHHNGRGSDAEKQPTGRGPGGCVENGRLLSRGCVAAAGSVTSRPHFYAAREKPEVELGCAAIGCEPRDVDFGCLSGC